MKKIYIIGIGGIGTSALARYYKNIGYEVFGSDKTESELTKTLSSEGIKVFYPENLEIIDKNFEKIVYSEAVSETNLERQKGKKLNIPEFSYPEDLGNITENYKLISVAGSHGKSTTTSIVSLILQNSTKKFTSIVGTLLKEFGGKNFYSNIENYSIIEETNEYLNETYDNEDSWAFAKSDHKPIKDKKQNKFFALESCEYKRHFLNYKPFVAIITNIDLDHLDYYKNLEDYISAFREFLENVRIGGFAVLNGYDENSLKLQNLRKDINYILVYNEYFELNGEKIFFPEMNLKVPGEHILFDAKLAFAGSFAIGISKKEIVLGIEKYSGAWRRNELLGETENGNLVISDYGHHPTEIEKTVGALKGKYSDKKIILFFQPHQYSRTFELLNEFVDCFNSADEVNIVDIYESRDSAEDKAKINSEILVEKIKHKNKFYSGNLEKSLERLLNQDKKEQNLVFVLMGAGDIDNLRFEIFDNK